MIATVTNHISKGVQNYNDMSKKMTWFKTNFNMPVPNYQVPMSPFTRYIGSWNYLTETTSYDLTGFVPGYEICNGCAIFDFENDEEETYDIDVVLYLAWSFPDGQAYWYAYWDYTYSLPSGYWVEVWYGANTGCAGWEVHTNDIYRFRSGAVGTPNIDLEDTGVTITNCPSTTQLGSTKPGYIWVEGNNLCYINANEWKHTMVGIQVSTDPGESKAGYIWIDTSNDLHWVGANGYEYKCAWKVKQYASFYSNGPTGEVNAGTSKKGFIWVDNEFGWTHLSYIGNDGYKYLTGAGDDPYA